MVEKGKYLLWLGAGALLGSAATLATFKRLHRQRGREFANVDFIDSNEMENDEDNLNLLHLPEEVIGDILSRLPIRAITRFKAVSKPWRQLIESPTFARTCYLNSVSKIVVYLENTPYQFIGFVGDDDAAAPKSRFPGCFKMLEFNIPIKELYSSADGLLFLCNQGMRNTKQAEWPRALYVCNPVNRDYIEIPSPESFSSRPQIQSDTFGFGRSRADGNYKVDRVFQDTIEERKEAAEWKCLFTQLELDGVGLYLRGLASMMQGRGEHL